VSCSCTYISTYAVKLFVAPKHDRRVAKFELLRRHAPTCLPLRYFYGTRNVFVNGERYIYTRVRFRHSRASLQMTLYIFRNPGPARFGHFRQTKVRGGVVCGSILVRRSYCVMAVAVIRTTRAELKCTSNQPLNIPRSRQIQDPANHVFHPKKS
jgi:hypothetical protein